MEEKQTPISEAQLVYARGLDAGVKLGLIVLIASFAAYACGVLPAAVPPERLPELWGLSAAQYVQHAGVPQGWGWTALRAGDMAVFASLAFSLSISMLCLLLLLPVYARRRDWAYLSLVVAEIGVLLLAASGVLVAGH